GETEIIYASHLILNICSRQTVSVKGKEEHVWNVTQTLRTQTSATAEETATAAANVSTLTAKRVITSVKMLKERGVQQQSSCATVVCGFSDGTLTSWYRSSDGAWTEQVLSVVQNGEKSLVEGRSITDVEGYIISGSDGSRNLAVVVCCSGGAFFFAYQNDCAQMQVTQSKKLLSTPSNVCKYHEIGDESAETLGVILVGTAAPRHNKIHVWAAQSSTDPPIYSGALAGHEDWITCFDWTTAQSSSDCAPNSRSTFLASGSQDAKIRLWKWVTTTVSDDSQQLPKAAIRHGSEDRNNGSDDDDDDDENDDADDEEMVEGEARLELFHGKNQLISVYLEALLIGHEEMVTSVAWHPNPQPTYQQDLILISCSMDRTIFIWSSTQGNNTGYGIGSNGDDTGGVWTPIARVGSAGGILGGPVGTSLLGFLNVQAEPIHGSWIMGHAYGGSLHFFSCAKLRDFVENEAAEQNDKKSIEERAALVQWQAQPCVTGHFAEVTDLCWEAHRGEYLITVGNDQTCRLWAPMETRNDLWIEVSRPQVHGYNLSAVTSLSTEDHRHLLISGADEKELRAFDGTLSFMRTLEMVTGTSNEAVQASDPRVERAYIPALGLTNKASAADGADEDTAGASKSDTKLLLERDLGSTSLWPEIRKLFGHNSEIARLASTHAARSCLSVQYSTPYINESLVASTTKARDVETAAIRLWDSDFRSRQTLKGGHRSTVTALSFSPNGTYLASSGKDRRLCIWKRRATPTNDQELFYLASAVDSSHKRIVWSVHFCPYEATTLATGSRDGTVKIWTIKETAANEEEEETHDVHEHCTFIPRPGEAASDSKASAVTALAFAPLRSSSSMGLLAVGYEDGLLQLWSAPIRPSANVEPSLIRSFDPNLCHIGAVHKLAWKPILDEENGFLTLASCSDDCGCRIFRIKASKDPPSAVGGKMKRRSSASRLFGFTLILLLCFCRHVGANAANGSHSSNKAVSSSAASTTGGGVLQVVESEVWDSASDEWRGAPGQRWTNEKGSAAASPSKATPPEGFAFDGDWKIVVPSNGDTMGWEYQFQYLRPPKRRRIWLRSLRPIPSQLSRGAVTKQQELESKASVPYALSSRRTLLTRIREDWNFKGFGMSLYKSFIFPESCGIGIRLPLTVNFDYFDSHPELPSVTCGTAVFLPGTVMGFVTASIHVDWIKWVLKSSLALLPRMILWTVYKVLIPILWTVATIALFPISERLPQPSAILPTTVPYGGFIISKPRYSTEISERVGCSVSYRYSIQRGYEFRISYWHSYLPTLLVYQKLWAQTLQQMRVLAKVSSSWKRSRGTGKINIAAESAPPKEFRQGWFQKHFGRLGVSTGYPIPTPPNFSCSAVLSLSGLYFGSNKAPTMVASTASTPSKDISVSPSNIIPDKLEKEAISSPPVAASSSGSRIRS
ncbi:MAG: hypothetical protein SGILL_002708, partial [Bacillariaceae sp.]